MIQARVYKPSRTATQSGKAKTRHWVLEFLPQNLSFVEPLMGWHGSKDTTHQIRLTFPSLESAIAYATQKQITVQIETPHPSVIRPKSYAYNFRFDRII